MSSTIRWERPTTTAAKRSLPARKDKHGNVSRVGIIVAKDFGPDHGVFYGHVVEEGVDDDADDGQPYLLVRFTDDDQEDMTESEFKCAKALAAEDPDDDGTPLSVIVQAEKKAARPAARYPLEKRLLHVHSWSNTAPQDGKGTLDCHFSFLKKALKVRAASRRHRNASGHREGPLHSGVDHGWHHHRVGGHPR